MKGKGGVVNREKGKGEEEKRKQGEGEVEMGGAEMRGGLERGE